MQVARDDGEGISRSWDGVAVSMFAGLPGYPEELQLASSCIFAAS